MLISLGRVASDATPVRTETEWSAFVAWLYSLPRRQSGLTPDVYAHLKTFPSKSPEGQRIHADKDGPYVCLADFGGYKRALDTLLHSSGVPLDFDSGLVTRSVIASTLQGYAYVAMTTYAHGAAGVERWRVFVPASRPMSAAEHYATWAQLSAAFPGGADPAAKDPSRLSYLPGACLYPSSATVWHAEGSLFVPAQPSVTDLPALVAGGEASGPVAGWDGPVSDVELITVACNTRTRPDERFGGPIHFAMLWAADEAWLSTQFPPSANEAGQPYSRTQADMALAGELAYWTGGHVGRMVSLMHQSGLARTDEDWQQRKAPRACERAAANAKQWAFMRKAAPPAAMVPMVSIDAAGNVQVATAAEATVLNAEGINDYWAYLPNGQFIHRPTAMLHVSSSVDGRIGKTSREAIVLSRPVHKMTWAPGYPERFQLREIDPSNDRGAEAWLYNKYQPPRVHDRVGDVTPWLELVRRLYPDDADHIVNYFADAVQFPQHKCNHALVLGSGTHGIGKDTLLAPLRHAVGEANYQVITPGLLVGTYNPWVATRILQVSESRDLGEGHAGISRYDMYERMKDLNAAPPKMLPCNDKYIAQHQVLNVLRPILTTNHAVDGLFLPPEDRRHYCAWSDAPKMEQDESDPMWSWYESGGLDWVANYLSTFDLSGFSRTAAPLHTSWWEQLVEGGRPAEDERFSDALDKLARPEWVTMPQVAEAGGLELVSWMQQPSSKRKVERMMDGAGYVKLPNPLEKRGRWLLAGKQIPIYRRKDVGAKALLHKFGA